MTEVITLPMDLGEVKAGHLAPIGEQEVKCVGVEVKDIKNSTDKCAVLDLQSMEDPDAWPIKHTIFFPKQADIQGMQNDGYVDAKGNEITKEKCARRVNAQMASLKQVMLALKVPYTNTSSGQSQFNPQDALNCLGIGDVRIVAPRFKDGEPALPMPPVTDPTNPPLNPNAAREMWPEGREIVWPDIPEEDTKAKGKKKK